MSPEAKSLTEAKQRGDMILDAAALAANVPAEDDFVTVRFDGGNNPGETVLALEDDPYVLPLGRPVRVPSEVADRLTSGDNANLYRVARVDDKQLDDEPPAASGLTVPDGPPTVTAPDETVTS